MTAKLRVFEMGGYAAGYAGRLFLRAGADVVRLESEAEQPAWVSGQSMQLYLHAGKRRVAGLDQQQIDRLIAAADVVVCEVACAEELKALRAQLAGKYAVVISPFGLTGPKRNWQATPSTLLAMGGYTYLMGDADKAPLNLPGHYLEFQAGTLGYAAVNAARLVARPELIDVSMFETLMSMSQFTTVRWHCAGSIRTRHGSDFWFVSPSDLFRCADGWVYINIVPAFWDAFLAFIELPELVIDPRFQTNDGRMEFRQPLLGSIAEAFANMSRQQIEQRAVECRVPLGVVRTLDDVLREPHLTERGYWEQVSDGTQQFRSPGLPFRINQQARAAYQLQAVTDQLLVFADDV